MFCALLFFLLGGAVFAQPPHFSQDLPPEELAEQLVNAMTEEEFLGQVLMFGYPEETPQKELLQFIEETGLGGVKVFGWNGRNLPVLGDTIKTYQKAAGVSRLGIPLLIATDQEGGWVRHIKGETSQTPGSMAIGAAGLPYDAWMTGWIIGRELGALGINMNFAPVIDVFSERRADVIGPRAFSSDPQQAGILGLAFYRGQEQAGIISTAKHFPGHGGTPEDSHNILPILSTEWETLAQRDLVPYQTLIAGGVPAVMAGHLAFPSITGTEEPATLSSFFLQDVLRDQMGFSGIIITDDLFMEGAQGRDSSLSKLSRRALEAGNDLLLISQIPDGFQSIVAFLREEIARDREFAAQVRESARRVVAAKIAYLKPFPKEVPPSLQGERSIPVPEAAGFFFDQASRSVSVIKKARIPLSPKEAGRVLLAGAYEEFFTQGLRRYPQAETYTLPLWDSMENMTRQGRYLARNAEKYDSIIFLLKDEESQTALKELAGAGKKVIVFSILSPVHLDHAPWVETALAAYGLGADSYAAGFAVLRGDFEASGRLPIPLPALP